MDGQDILLFNCIGIFPKSILVFVDFVVVIRMNASLYLLNAPNTIQYNTIRGRSRGRVQGVRTPLPPEMTCGFLIQLVFCQKKKLCGLLVLK